MCRRAVFCTLSIHGRELKLFVSSQFTVVGWSPATVFFKTTVVDCSFYSTLCKTTLVGCSFYSTLCKTTVVGCSFYSTLCKTTVVGCSPPIISGKYYLRITPNGYKGSAFFAFCKKSNYELRITTGSAEQITFKRLITRYTNHSSRCFW